MSIQAIEIANTIESLEHFIPIGENVYFCSDRDIERVKTKEQEIVIVRRGKVRGLHFGPGYSLSYRISMPLPLLLGKTNIWDDLDLFNVDSKFVFKTYDEAYHSMRHYF